MALRLRRRGSSAASLRRIATRELRRTERDLTARHPPADRRVHEARKRLKKVRAALRLERDAIGKREYRRENLALRDAARPLSAVRDARVLIETLDRIAKRAPRAARPDFAAARRLLIAHRDEVHRQVLGSPRVITPIVTRVETVRGRAKRWPAGRNWETLGDGIRRVYRNGRDAFAAARREPSDENLHEWRKQSKYLWLALQMLEPMRPRMLEKLGDQAHRLSDRLGHDHDLAVLRQRLSHTHPGDGVPSMAAIVDAIDARRQKLRRQTFALGERVYADKPRVFCSRLHEYWREWRDPSRRH